MEEVRDYEYVMSKSHYSELLRMFGTKANIIKYINETYFLMRLVTDIKIVG